MPRPSVTISAGTIRTSGERANVDIVFAGTWPRRQLPQRLISRRPSSKARRTGCRENTCANYSYHRSSGTNGSGNTVRLFAHGAKYRRLRKISSPHKRASHRLGGEDRFPARLAKVSRWKGINGKVSESRDTVLGKRVHIQHGIQGRQLPIERGRSGPKRGPGR